LRLRSDAALAERFAEGDEAAFAILFERHRASVVAVCIGVLGSRHDAEDAAQETFASLAVALRSSPPRELRAWLARVARNSAIDLARRRRTRESVNDQLSDISGPDGVSASHLVKDELASVIAGIRELPESQRTALLMRELAGHSYREIADLLESDEDAVRGLIARARVGLRQYREATELPCATARAAIASEPDGRRHHRTIRRHVRGCASCRAYRSALREDARVLRGLLPMQAGGAAGGSAVVGLAAKGALLGTAATQVTAACAVSVCAVGGIALIAPALTAHPHRAANVAVHLHRLSVQRSSHLSHPAATSAVHAPAGVRSAGFRPSAAAVATTTGARTRARLGSAHASMTTNGSRAHLSVTTRSHLSVSAGGHQRGSSQQSGGQYPASTGRGSGTGSGGSPTGDSPGNGNSPPGGSGASGRGSMPRTAPTTYQSSPPFGGGGAGASDAGWLSARGRGDLDGLASGGPPSGDPNTPPPGPDGSDGSASQSPAGSPTGG
jgi:RNA polymerase sigma factor (sigma-70 family)